MKRNLSYTTVSLVIALCAACIQLPVQEWPVPPESKSLDGRWAFLDEDGYCYAYFDFHLGKYTYYESASEVRTNLFANHVVWAHTDESYVATDKGLYQLDNALYLKLSSELVDTSRFIGMIRLVGNDRIESLSETVTPLTLERIYSFNTSPHPSQIDIEKFSLDKSELHLVPLGSEKLNVSEFLPASLIDKRVNWKSSDPKIVDVDCDGTVTGLAPGTATVSAIPASNPEFAAECAVEISGDLSWKGRSNCYVVPSEGRYSFYARVRGNSHDPVGEIASCSVLWRSSGCETPVHRDYLLSDCTFSGDSISFTANGSDGNAVVAALDAAGQVLWSWHLWFCLGYDPDNPFFSRVCNNGSGMLMDRNLGATTGFGKSLSSYGLVYQWGRKDPFPLLTWCGHNDSAIPSSSFSQAVPIPETETDPIAYSILHPECLLYAQASDGGDQFDWIPSSTHPAGYQRWAVEEKSKYDPCPYGWAVPSGDFWIEAAGGMESFPSFPIDGGGVDFSGIFCPSDSGPLWFPAGGYIKNDTPGITPSSPDYTGGWWTGRVSEDLHFAIGLSLDLFETPQIRLDASMCPREARYVRCVRYNDEPILK